MVPGGIVLIRPHDRDELGYLRDGIAEAPQLIPALPVGAGIRKEHRACELVGRGVPGCVVDQPVYLIEVAGHALLEPGRDARQGLDGSRVASGEDARDRTAFPLEHLLQVPQRRGLIALLKRPFDEAHSGRGRHLCR